MRFYCPIEANPGTGPQKTVDHFMTINSIWSRESLIITRVVLPGSFSQSLWVREVVLSFLQEPAGLVGDLWVTHPSFT